MSAAPRTLNDRAVTRALVALAFAGFAAQSMVRVTDSLLPQIAADLSVSVAAASAVVTVYALAHGTVQLFVGAVGDRFGHFRCVTFSVLAGTVLTLLCGFAGTLAQLITARLACGLAVGWIVPLAFSYIGDVIPYERRQAVLGQFLSGQIIGQLSGQAMGGVLGDLFGWRNVFVLLAGLFALATVGVVHELLRNPATQAQPKTEADTTGMVASYKAVLGTPWARVIIIVVFLEAALMFGAFAFVGADLHLRFGLSFTTVGLFVAAFAFGGLLYSLTVRLLVPRLGQTGLAAGGGVLLCLAYASLALLPAWWLAPLCTVVAGFGFYMLHNTLQTNATQMTPHARGTAVAIFSAALYLGQTVGVALAAPVFDRFGGVVLFGFSAVMLGALGLWLARAIQARHAAGMI